jgi:hypothetical protein
MIHGLRRISLFALYQIVVFLGIVLMPVALAASRLGVSLPVGRLVESVGSAYEDVAA